MELLTASLLLFFGGVFPTFIWLYFWLKEDAKNPEPKWVITKTFIFGMLAVPVAGALQYLIKTTLFPDSEIQMLFFEKYFFTISILVVWATIEEVFKYIAGLRGGLSNSANNEPLDAFVYMVTAGLGFAALENSLFLFDLVRSGDTLVNIIVTGNMRFLGASVLHIISSGIVGIFIALSYYKKNEIKKRYLLSGLILAITLHSIFNSFIIRSDGFTLVAFAMSWLVALVLILYVEKIKNKKLQA